MKIRLRVQHLHWAVCRVGGGGEGGKNGERGMIPPIEVRLGVPGLLGKEVASAPTGATLCLSARAVNETCFAGAKVLAQLGELQKGPEG